jgi:TRAP-type mannitol/chloroaromatic compound transport system permease small subunit
VKILIPLGFFLLTLQGLSEIIKRIAALTGHYQLDARYERPLQ